VGHVYLDLFPRPGKFGHQMIYPLFPTFEDSNGRVCRPACCYVGNISKPLADTEPALLRYGEVKTMFHELGHIFHAISCNVRYSALSWTWPIAPWPGGVEQDALEIPSMMFEQWMTIPDVVERIASHYREPERKISKDIVDRLRASRNLFHTALHSKYWAMSLYDLHAHSDSPPYARAGDDDGSTMSHVDLFRFYVEKVAKRRSVGTDPTASWYHPCIGYDAGYYSYAFSEVYALDLFSIFKRDGVLDAKLGRRFRRQVLAPGASRPGMEILRTFLGREPSLDAYCEEYGYGD